MSSMFRLLDERVGWDERSLDGVSLEGGALSLRVERAALPPERIAPPRLAWMCETCTWWLAGEAGVSRLGPCDERFTPWLQTPAPALAVAARGVRLAVVVAGEGVRVFDVPTGHQIGEFALPNATAVSLTPWGHVLVGDTAGVLHDLDLSGLPCRTVDTGTAVARIAHTPSGPCRTLAVHDDGSIAVVRGGQVRRGSGSLLDLLAPTGIAAATALGFTVARGSFAWDGAPLDTLGPGDARYAQSGTYRSEALNSGIPGCRWHRLRVDADVPAGTTLRVAFAGTDGAPHPDDWFEAGTGVTDTILTSSPGQYGHVRIELTGDGFASPVVHQVRLDLPGASSARALPAVYSDDLDARDFTGRFLALFDASLEQLDEVIARRDALLDPDALPDDALGWVGGLLGLGFEAEMTSAQRRALIAAAPELYRRRGTPDGLVKTLAIAIGVEATVEELGPARPWGAAGSARLGAVRLFGRSRARLRLGSSALGTAPLLARGNPDDDARVWGAHRLVVTVPPGSPRALIERIVRSQTPAHVVATVRMPAAGFVLTDPRLGIDTVLLDPAPAVVGSLRLGRSGVLRRGRASSLAIVGKSLIASPTTRME